jgi:antitoxin (DNA-binding transcriptional repressor) of toxin-antitoxin stability system
MHEAKTHLSRLVEAAARGGPFVMARAGKPLVKAVALEEAPQRKPQRIGFLKGRFTYDPEGDRRLDKEIRREFEASIARGLLSEGSDRDGNPVEAGRPRT